MHGQLPKGKLATQQGQLVWTVDDGRYGDILRRQEEQVVLDSGWVAHWRGQDHTSLPPFKLDEHGRAIASMTVFGILPRFTGVAVHDAYSGYDSFTTATHALCNAHILREATGIGEFDPQARDS